MYKVILYTFSDGKSPIKEFLDSSDTKLRVKILRQLKYLEEFGLNFAVPNLKKFIGTHLWEIRILGKDNIRLFCVSCPQKEIKILHIFKKKTQKTPAREIKTALNRYRR